MRYTLLQMVQRILESMDSDEVNSLADTTESLAVANIIKECYGELIAEYQPHESDNLFHLDASTDSTKPTMMLLPSYVTNIKTLKYNVGETLDDSNLRELRYMPVMDFLNYMNGLDVNESWVHSMLVTLDGHDFRVKYRSDQSPHYYTSSNDKIILMDSYDSSYESTLTSSRTYGYGAIEKTFSLEDSFIPDLDPRHFPLLLNMAKAQAFVELKQTENAKTEKKERRHRLLAYKTKDSTDNRTALQRHQGYGRR